MLVLPLHNGTCHIAQQDRATSMSPGAKDSICHSRLTCCRGCDTTDWQSSASLKCKQLCQKEFFLIRRNLEATFYKNLLSRFLGWLHYWLRFQRERHLVFAICILQQSRSKHPANLSTSVSIFLGPC